MARVVVVRVPDRYCTSTTRVSPFCAIAELSVGHGSSGEYNIEDSANTQVRSVIQGLLSAASCCGNQRERHESYRHRLPPGGRPLRYENHDVTARVSRRFDGRPTESRRYEQGQPGLSIRWNPDVHPVVRSSLVAKHVGPAGFSDLEARWELFKATQIRPTSAASKRRSPTWAGYGQLDWSYQSKLCRGG